MLSKKELWEVDLPEPTWDSILTYLWKDKFSQNILNQITQASEIRLKTVEVVVYDKTNQYRYICCQIWRLVSNDTMIWPPPSLTSWREENPVEIIEKTYSPARQDDDKYRTYPMKHDLIHPKCYSL